MRPGQQRDIGRRRPCRIALAEDDPTNQYVIRAILVAAGHSVDVFENGELAIDGVRSDPPDLILLDMMMPVLDGYDTAQRLALDPAFDGIPILALTAKAMKGDLERSLESGCDAYMSKPVGRRALLEMVEFWLSRPVGEWMPARVARRAQSTKRA